HRFRPRIHTDSVSSAWVLNMLRQHYPTPEGCPHCATFSTKTLEKRLRVAATGKSDPCLSAQPREEPMECPQSSSSWGDMMDSVSPVLLLLFEDPLVGEEDDDDEVLSTILEDEDNDDEDAILPPNQPRLRVKQSYRGQQEVAVYLRHQYSFRKGLETALRVSLSHPFRMFHFSKENTQCPLFFSLSRRQCTIG
ncbi:hypothetical protein M9458_054943, partial [Cirrhinus mrigala]